MALYLGSEKVKLNLNNAIYNLNLFTKTHTADYVGLLSFDNYILQDCNGIYLLSSDYVSPIVDGVLLSLDNYILKDCNGLYLTIKESE